MNLSNYISRNISTQTKDRFSKPIVYISIISVALGVSVLILVFAITSGFRKEIENKVIGFGSHIEISFFDDNASYQKTPIEKNAAFLTQIKKLDNVKKIQAYALKAGIIKTSDEIEGIVLKGLDTHYDVSFFQTHLVRGKVLHLTDTSTSNEAIISESLANKLHLDTGSRMLVYFVQDPPRQRMFRVCGIYKSELSSFDQTYALCDLKHIQKLNDWNEHQIDGFEILLHDFSQLEKTNTLINQIIPFHLISQTIVTRNQDLFNWIGLFDQNIIVLLVLIIIVISISVISTQLTLMLEQIPTIGILKTLGCTNQHIRNIFLHISSRILIKGLIIGNAIGLILCLIQKHFHLIKLNPDNYYMSHVPIDIVWYHPVLINILIITISLFMLSFPTYFVGRKINITDSIRLE